MTQTPKDVPADVLAQLGNRVQHALRAFTPDDAKALKATASTFPRSSYDLEEVLTQLGIGEAIITVLSERGAPTPVAWTMLRAPQGSMSPLDAAQMNAAVAASPLAAEYGQQVDRESAYDDLPRNWLRRPRRQPNRRLRLSRAGRRTAGCSTIPFSRQWQRRRPQRSDVRSCAASSAPVGVAAGERTDRAPIWR